MVVHVLEENSSRTVSLSLQNISTLLVDLEMEGYEQEKKGYSSNAGYLVCLPLQPTFEHISSSKQYKNKKERRFQVSTPKL